MKNIKKFKEFQNPINEGLISWATKTFKPKELDKLIKEIVNKIIKNFDIDKLDISKRFWEGHYFSKLYSILYEYKIPAYGPSQKYDIIKIKYSTDTNNYDVWLNDDLIEVPELVNKYYIEKLVKFFNDVLSSEDLAIEDSKRRRKIKMIQNKYRDHFPDDEEL